MGVLAWIVTTCLVFLVVVGRAGLRGGELPPGASLGGLLLSGALVALVALVSALW